MTLFEEEEKKKKERATTEEAFALIKHTVSYIIRKYGYHSVNYCLVLREENSINFDKAWPSLSVLHKMVDELTKTRSSSRIYEDLCAARDAFKSPKVRKEAKKVK